MVPPSEQSAPTPERSPFAVVTAAQGDHDSLQRLHRALSAGRVVPRQLVVVALDDEELIGWDPDEGVEVSVLPMSIAPEGVPWAEAKNAGATAALSDGARGVVFVEPGVEVDDETLGALLDALGTADDTLVWADVEDDGVDPDDFANAAFAISLGAWSRTGGFHEHYIGSGHEDADLMRAAAEQGVHTRRAGNVVVRRPPHHDRDDSELGRNTDLFRSRWHTDPPAASSGW